MPKSQEKQRRVQDEEASKTGLTVPVYSLAGTPSGEMALPKKIFNAKVNLNLLAQAVRVYYNALKGHWSHTKTRGEVAGSTRKVYRQKHTGRARHGAVTAPIWVGGGIALGPKARKVTLELPQKMKKSALVSALAQKLTEKEVLGVTGLEKASGKTKQMANLIQKLGKGSALIVTDKTAEKAILAVRNIEGVSLISADQLNAFEVIKHQSLILTREAVERLQSRLLGNLKAEEPKEVIKKTKKGAKAK